MKITSPMLGEVDVSPERILDFPTGLPGFEPVIHAGHFVSGSGQIRAAGVPTNRYPLTASL